MDKKFLKTYFICAAATLLFAFLLWNWKDTAGFAGFVLHAFRPVIIGVVFAFLLNRSFERIKRLLHRLFPGMKPGHCNAVAVAAVYFLLLGALAAILWVVIPRLIDSFNLLASNLDGYYQNAVAVTERLMSFGGHNWWKELKLEQELLNLTKELPSILQGLFSGVASAVTGTVGTVADCVIGLVLSVYGLAQKQRLLRQASRLLRAVAGKHAERVAGFFSLIARTFSDYLNGQLVEAGILGLLCFLGMTLLGFDYAVLISVLAAVTNLVPVVGPIAGAVAGAFILFLTDPVKALWFLAFMILLQQVEANFIYPRVVGASVGLPGIWVLASVVTGGSLFGVAGMLFAVPAASVIYQTVKGYVLRRCGPEPPDRSEEELILYQNGKTKPKN